MDIEKPILSGYLNVPTQFGFSLNRISRKKPCQRYCLLFKSSRHGIERLEICESKEDKNPKIITLENCVKITKEPAPANLIQIVKKTGTLTLNAHTEDDLKEWINALQTVAFRDKGGTLGRNIAIEEDNDLYCSSYGDGLFIVTLIPSETSIRCCLEHKPYMLHLTATELQLKSSEDFNNIVAKWPYRFIRKYGYRDGKFTFEAGRKCNTGEGVFTLDHTNPQDVFRCMSSKMKSMKKLINGDNLNNIDCGENQLSAAMSMEAGSRSPLPPSPCNQNQSDFEINSNHSCVSFRGIVSSSDSLNNVNSNSSLTIANVNPSSVIPILAKHVPNNSLKKTEHLHLQPTYSTSSSACTVTIVKGELRNKIQQSCDKQKLLQSYEPVSITTIDQNKMIGTTVVLKQGSPELNKMPHHASSNNITQQNSNFQRIPPDLPVRNESCKFNAELDYESIETITDAWKTLGVCDVKHTERISPLDDAGGLIWQKTNLVREKNKVSDVTITKILDADASKITSESDYDRLDFLVPNNSASGGYKTVVSVSSFNNRKILKTLAPNEYEIIAGPDIHTSRLMAGEGISSYGVLRKNELPVSQVGSDGNTTTILNNATNNQTLDHQSYNGLNYTIVSKPKRV